MIDKRNKETEEDFKERYGCMIENFIKDAYSICREERQYAVFLYNILRYYRNPDKRGSGQVKTIFDACRIPEEAVVKQVFYEATFMRDFFERNRRSVLGKGDPDKFLNKTFSPCDYKISEPHKYSFNYKLLEYVLGDSGSMNFTQYSEEERNLGRNKTQMRLSENSREDQEYASQIQWMMNAKPDIAVVYEKDKENYLLFLECKFESDMDSYSATENQSRIQWRIADFLCKYYLNGKVKVSDRMENESSCLVRFVRKWKEGKEQDGEIGIENLINLNRKEIFHEEDE